MLIVIEPEDVSSLKDLYTLMFEDGIANNVVEEHFIAFISLASRLSDPDNRLYDMLSETEIINIVDCMEELENKIRSLCIRLGIEMNIRVTFSELYTDGIYIAELS